MIKTLELTDEHIALISNLKVGMMDDGSKLVIKKDGCYGGTYIIEDMALILGYLKDAYPGTEEDPDGRKFPKDIEDHMWELHDYIWNNMDYIMSLVLQFIEKGGLTPGKYQCIDRVKVWTKKEV